MLRIVESRTEDPMEELHYRLRRGWEALHPRMSLLPGFHEPCAEKAKTFVIVFQIGRFWKEDTSFEEMRRYVVTFTLKAKEAGHPDYPRMRELVKEFFEEEKLPPRL